MKNLIKKLIKSICLFLYYSVDFVIYILCLIRHSAYKNPIKKDKRGTIAVLANGPSLKETLSKIEDDDEFKNVDYIVLNYFANESLFTKIKPKYYCFADPMFFEETHKTKEAKQLFNVLQNKVDWDMYIYVPKSFKNRFIKFSGINNKSIHIIGVNCIAYKGFPSIKHYFFKQGLAIPNIATVAILAIYVCMNKGYDRINLYGVDHTFFDSLCVNENNELCNQDCHFYDNKKPLLKPIRRNDNSQIWKISDYLQSITNMFKGHDELAAYAKYLKIQVYNCTRCSMIDSYQRKDYIIK